MKAHGEGVTSGEASDGEEMTPLQDANDNCVEYSDEGGIFGKISIEFAS